MQNKLNELYSLEEKTTLCSSILQFEHDKKIFSLTEWKQKTRVKKTGLLPSRAHHSSDNRIPGELQVRTADVNTGGSENFRTSSLQHATGREKHREYLISLSFAFPIISIYDDLGFQGKHTLFQTAVPLSGALQNHIVSMVM